MVKNSCCTMVNHNKTLEGLHMTDQNDQSENNPSISGRVERIIPPLGKMLCSRCRPTGSPPIYGQKN